MLYSMIDLCVAVLVYSLNYDYDILCNVIVHSSVLYIFNDACITIVLSKNLLYNLVVDTHFLASHALYCARILLFIGDHKF